MKSFTVRRINLSAIKISKKEKKITAVRVTIDSYGIRVCVLFRRTSSLNEHYTKMYFIYCAFFARGK